MVGNSIFILLVFQLGILVLWIGGLAPLCLQRFFVGAVGTVRFVAVIAAICRAWRRRRWRRRRRRRQWRRAFWFGRGRGRLGRRILRLAGEGRLACRASRKCSAVAATRRRCHLARRRRRLRLGHKKKKKTRMFIFLLFSLFSCFPRSLLETCPCLWRKVSCAWAQRWESGYRPDNRSPFSAVLQASPGAFARACWGR